VSEECDAMQSVDITCVAGKHAASLPTLKGEAAACPEKCG